jgi:hypothetical protein
MNKDTAVTQYGLNATNQVTPYGNLTYDQIGQWDDGTPRFQATQSLSPEMQDLYNKYSGIASNLGDIGTNLSDNVKDEFSQPFSLDNEAVEGRIFELGSKRLDPMFSEGEESLRTRLMNQGLQPGTPAFDAEMRNFSEGKNDAYNNLLLTGRQQAGGELLTERNQSLNEMIAALTGTQTQNPNYVNTPQPGVSGVDYAGLVQSNYANASDAYNAKISGLFGMGKALAGGWATGGFGMPSDRRIKRDIRRIGTADNGLPIYVYRLAGSKIPQIGFMADEVQKMHPDAVVNVGGIDHVRYDLAVR